MTNYPTFGLCNGPLQKAMLRSREKSRLALYKQSIVPLYNNSRSV